VQSLALDVPSRLARYLFQAALASASGYPQAYGWISHAEERARLGARHRPEDALARVAKLKADGLITVRGSAVTILDVRSLADLGQRLFRGLAGLYPRATRLLLRRALRSRMLQAAFEPFSERAAMRNPASKIR